MRYSAFISYNHRDRAWASWLHRALERYRIPKPLRGRDTAVGVLGKRLPPVFQDREELAASTDLARSVQEALAEAATLIVICSPNAARSRWVNEEVRTFIAAGRAGRIQCLVVDGEPGLRDAADPLACFPPALIEAGVEPLAADVRPDGDGKRAALLKLIAGVLGVGYDELRRRDAMRRQRQLAVVATLATTGLAGTSALAAFALVSRQDAIAQRDIARQRTATAERTVDFVKSMFAESDPSEAKGATITAREILDRGARRISSSLNDEPAVKTELLTTLGEVYTGLGLFRQGDALLRSSLKVAGSDPRSVPRQFAALGESQSLQSDYAGAVKSFEHGLAAARDPARPDTKAEPRLLEGLSEAKAALEDFPGADAAAELALTKARAEFGAGSPEVARAQEALGLSAYFSGKLDRARDLFQAALRTRERRQGELHPKVNEDLNMLGGIAYMQRDGRATLTYYRRALASAIQVQGSEHPAVGAIQANLGRILVEQRHYAEAVGFLHHAAVIDEHQRDANHDDLAFILANLALAERGLGHGAKAEALLSRAIRIARLHKHRNLAPAMTDLADTFCARGETAPGLALSAEARPIMAATYPDDPWRVAWADHVRGACLLRAGNVTEGQALMRGSAPALERRWAADTLYGERARALSAPTHFLTRNTDGQP